MDEDRRDRTLWCGNLDPKVTEELLRELFVQAGPVEDVKIPKDNNGRSKNFAFVTFVHSESVGYTIALMDGVSLYRRRIRMERRPKAAVDDTYVNMMERHYQYMNSVRASANMFHPPGSMWGSSCAPQHEMEQRNQMPMDMPFPSERSFGYESARNGPHAYPPGNDSKCYDRYYGQDRHEQQDRYDRQGRHFRAVDPYRESCREFRCDKEDADRHNKHRGRNGYDRRYEETRYRRFEDRGDYHAKRRRYWQRTLLNHHYHLCWLCVCNWLSHFALIVHTKIIYPHLCRRHCINSVLKKFRVWSDLQCLFSPVRTDSQKHKAICSAGTGFHMGSECHPRRYWGSVLLTFSSLCNLFADDMQRFVCRQK